MKKISCLLLILFMAVSCKAKEPDTGQNTENNEPVAQTENTASDTGSNNFDQLCQKLVDEMKTMGTPELVLEQTRGGCMQAAEAYQGKVASAEAFVNHMLETCEGKSGKDWFDCYNTEAQNAAQKAAAADNMPISAAHSETHDEMASEPVETANHKSEETPAKADDTAKTSQTNVTGKYTFNALCDKLSNEMGSMGVPAANIEQSRQACKQGGAALSQNQTMMESYVKHVMTACEGKSGQAWFACYSTEAQVAAQKMAGM